MLLPGEVPRAKLRALNCDAGIIFFRPREFQTSGSESQLLHVASHVAVKDHPKIKRTIDLLDFLECIGIGNLDFHSEVLLSIDKDGFGKPESGHR